MESMVMQNTPTQFPIFVKQQNLFTPSMLFYQGSQRQKNKARIATEYERFYGLSVSKIRKYVIPARLEEYDKKHHFGSGDKKKKKDDIARTMYGVFRFTDDFVKTNRVIIKTHVIYTKYPNEGEHISLPPFLINDVKYTPWEESDLCDFVTNYEFLFLVFENNVDREKERKNKNTFLSCIFYVKMKKGHIVEIRKVYERTKKIIWEGIKQWPVMNKDGSIRMCPVNTERPVMANNLPKAEESYICHVRPHADPLNPEKLENGEFINRQSFWLNRNFIRDLVEENRVHGLFEGCEYGT